MSSLALSGSISASASTLFEKYNMSLSFLTMQTDSAREHPLPSTNYELDHLLTSEQAAGVLGLSPKTLANWRVQGIENLPYRKVGKLFVINMAIC